ncbi:hypothetical protein [Mucilaginibacter flavus]|uniref:hypothetical protein n=1 Tax=Mucilaginibacter flavus TaxID=931504 RepID=UPI0025B5890F|nr:hypothetical protein [Mucilaginibacter flavus]MDN3583975.1 hypothetical protein [Mucilaginibacter flavus]
MSRLYFIVFFFLLLIQVSCVSRRPMPDNSQVLSQHIAPFRIHYVGGYSRRLCVLTLVDADKRYFTVLVPLDTAFKRGGIYGN